MLYDPMVYQKLRADDGSGVMLMNMLFKMTAHKQEQHSFVICFH